MRTKDIQNRCRLDNDTRNIFKLAMQNLGLFARAYSWTLKIARTIADLEDSTLMQAQHFAVGLQYRRRNGSKPKHAAMVR